MTDSLVILAKAFQGTWTILSWLIVGYVSFKVFMAIIKWGIQDE